MIYGSQSEWEVQYSDLNRIELGGALNTSEFMNNLRKYHGRFLIPDLSDIKEGFWNVKVIKDNNWSFNNSL